LITIVFWRKELRTGVGARVLFPSSLRPVASRLLQRRPRRQSGFNFSAVPTQKLQHQTSGSFGVGSWAT